MINTHSLDMILQLKYNADSNESGQVGPFSTSVKQQTFARSLQISLLTMAGVRREAYGYHMQCRKLKALVSLPCRISYHAGYAKVFANFSANK